MLTSYNQTVNIFTPSYTSGSYRWLSAARGHQNMKRSKYRNKKTEFNGVMYASRLEAEYAALLAVRLKAGEIDYLETQKRFDAVINGKKCFAYIADFYFFDKVANRWRIVDVKGFETDVFKLKRKVIEALHGNEIELVKRGNMH